MKNLEKLIHEARRQGRFPFSDLVSDIFDDYYELHGDRVGQDDLSISVGLASLSKSSLMIIGINKGITQQDNIIFNFGSPRPNAYRKAARAVKLASKFNLPIITFINTPGASASVQDEYEGQATAIGELIALFGLINVPTISVFTGEGESGGALALANTDKIIMFENSIFSVASPEAFSSILFKMKSDISWENIEKLPMTATDLYSIGICDAVISEEGISYSSIQENLKVKILSLLEELNAKSTQTRISDRKHKLDKVTQLDYDL